MADINAQPGGTLRIGELTVNRMGFGAMRLTGDGIWGPPANPEEAKRVLRRLPEIGVNFIDTADAYGPFVSEELIGEVLAPYKGIVVATKGGLTRGGPNIWAPVGRPEYLRQCVLMSLGRLQTDRIDLWQLHRIDPKVPRDEQFSAIADMQREGLIRYVGLSEVNVEEIQAASRYFSVMTVQNIYNVAHRQHEAVLEHCAKQGIGFIPWFPLAAGELTKEGGPLDTIARRLNATPSQVALAWTLRRSPVMLPIPGTSKVSHLEENVAAAAIKLSEADYRTLDEQGRAEWARQQAARPQ